VVGKACVNASPGASSGDTHSPASAVLVCRSVSQFTQVTRSPARTRTSTGPKANPRITTRVEPGTPSPTGKLHTPSTGAVASCWEKHPASPATARPAAMPKAVSARHVVVIDQWTTTVPVIKGWGVHLNGNVPARENVMARRSPESKSPVSKLPS
jgi:hypothetical protein